MNLNQLARILEELGPEWELVYQGKMLSVFWNEAKQEAVCIFVNGSSSPAS